MKVLCFSESGIKAATHIGALKAIIEHWAKLLFLINYCFINLSISSLVNPVASIIFSISTHNFNNFFAVSFLPCSIPSYIFLLLEQILHQNQLFYNGTNRKKLLNINIYRY